MLTYSSRQRTPRNSNKGVQQFGKVNQSLLYFKQFRIIIINEPCILDLYHGAGCCVAPLLTLWQLWVTHIPLAQIHHISMLECGSFASGPSAALHNSLTQALVQCKCKQQDTLVCSSLALHGWALVLLYHTLTFRATFQVSLTSSWEGHTMLSLGVHALHYLVPRFLWLFAILPTLYRARPYQGHEFFVVLASGRGGEQTSVGFLQW